MKLIIGLALVVAGMILLLQNLGIVSYDFGGIFWPVLIMAIGVKLLFNKDKHHMGAYCGHHAEEVKK